MDKFTKYEGSPVFGDRSTGTMFDAFVRSYDGRLRMDVSWRPQKALAVAFSDDGIHWTEPEITLRFDESSGWEDNLNRNCVLPAADGNGWLMWYTGQAKGWSYIGVARSEDGIHFERFLDGPVIVPEAEYEKPSTMNPFVMFDGGKYRMWYAAGEQYEPNVICCAESPDGIHWTKYAGNPVFRGNPEKEYEQERVGAVDILRDERGYLMFYIGYRDINTACICAARSADGITEWKRVPCNPLVTPTPGAWDADSCYKPTAVRQPDGSYRIWYNGRRGGDEFIGMAYGTIEEDDA